MKKSLRRRFVLPLFLLFFAVIALGFSTRDVQAATAKSKALKAYKKFLAQDTIPWDDNWTVSSSSCSFALAYINNNTVPELILTSTESYHVSGFGRLYTYRNGKVQQVGTLALDSNFYYYKKKGIFIDCYMQSGCVVYSYAKLSKLTATTKLQKSTYNDYSTGTQTTTYLSYTSSKCTTITRGKFNSKLKKLIGSTKKTKAKFYKNTAAKRKKYLK